MTRNEPEILKLQKQYMAELGSNVLVYPENRKWITEIPLTKELNKLFGKNQKIYMWGYIDNLDKLNLTEKVQKEDW